MALKTLGCSFVYADTPIDRLKPAAAPASATSAPRIAGLEHPATKCATLDELKKAMLAFKGCSLKATALNTVFADGNPESPLMLIGEAPGAEEDERGLPFVGQSGKLLDKILLAAGFKREDVYIANIVPWRPPGNRTPTFEEIAACRPFVEKHVELIKPKVLMLLGGIAAKTLLNSNETITRLRGRFWDYKQANGATIPCVATFHPAYLLRSPGQKAQIWHDALRVKIRLELESRLSA